MISRRALLAGASGLIASPALAFPVITPAPRRLDQVVKRLGLWDDAAFILDPSDPRSYLSGQTWFDLTTNDVDWYRGADGSASTDDPTFVGTPGQLSAGEYWLNDGGDRFKVISNNAFIKGLHKDGVASTLVMVAQFPNFASVQVTFATARLGTQSGIRHGLDTSGRAIVGYFNGSGSVQTYTTTIAATAGQPTVLVISHDETGGATGSHIRINGQVETFDGTLSAPSAADPAVNMTLCANENGTLGFVNGTRLWPVMGFNSALSQTQTQALYQSLIARAA